jgi:hypothetical protein
MYYSLKDYQWWNRGTAGTDCLNTGNLLPIAWLGSSRPTSSFSTSNYLYYSNYTYLKPSLVKIVYIFR